LSIKDFFPTGDQTLEKKVRTEVGTEDISDHEPSEKLDWELDGDYPFLL